LCKPHKRRYKIENKLYPQPTTFLTFSKPEPSLQIPTCLQNVELLGAAVLRNTGEEKFKSLIALGDSYQRGCFPFYKPHEMIARECFRTASLSPYPVTAATAESRLNSLRVSPLRAVDRNPAAHQMPHATGQNSCAHCMQLLHATQIKHHEHEYHNSDLVRARRVQRQQQHARQERERLQRQEIARQQPAVAEEAVQRIDFQNTHDSAVTAGTRANILKLQRDHRVLPTTSIVQEVKDSIAFSDDITPEEIENANRLLDALTHSVHGTFGTSEQNALKLVWQRIQDNPDPGVRTNTIEQLGKQLATGVEHGHTVCSTGRIARIMSVLDGAEEDAGIQRIRPVEAVKEELATLANRVRDAHMNNRMTANERDTYNAGENTAAVEAMKKDYADQVRKIYVDELRMEQTVIDPLVTVYSEGF
jgi:hypothetical protein